MENAAIISGYSVYLPFAQDAVQLISKIKDGERVCCKPWFKTEKDALNCGFNGNKNIAILEHVNDSATTLLFQQIENALAQAMLSEHCLSGENVRVYLTGLGPRVDGFDYKSFYDHNDIEDIAVSNSIAQLHINNMSQDNIALELARKYQLKIVPPNLNCTSNSALTALHLGCQAIEQSDIDIVVVINYSKIKTQDIWFLTVQSMLDTEVVQPFGERSGGVKFAEGISVMLLESQRHRQRRGESSGIRLQSVYSQISASRGNDPAWLSASMLKVMNKALQKAAVTVEGLAAIVPHGNGSAVSDHAEARALLMLTGKEQVPVLAWKGQIGYTATGSGLVDLVIAHHALSEGELLTPPGNEAIAADIAHLVLTDRGVIKHQKKHLLKMGVGVDGSLIGMVLSTSNSKG